MADFCSVYVPAASQLLHRCLLLVEQGFEAINWQRLIDDVQHYTEPPVNGCQRPTVLVEGTMILNYRLS